ncbi:MAG: TlpA family protein disulfide reductase [Suilimivivens sp.]
MADKASEISFSSFAVTDLNGNAVTQDIFKDYDVTMINVWATWCGPCRRELPDIQAAYEKLPANVNIISICDDAGQETELAGQIVEKVGIQYAVLVPDDAMDEFLNEYISAFPTTFLVDKEGNVIGQPIVGVPQADDVTQYYLDYIGSALQ